MTEHFRLLSARTALGAFLGASGLLAMSPAFGHHAMDGQTPTTLAEGLLSGLAHPVIGLDHLAFVLALGWLLSRLPQGLRLALAAAFVVGSLLGTVLHLNDVDLPASELLVALSVLAAGIVIVLRRLPSAALLWVALPLAGVFHGYAYGESIVGAEPGALGGYLVGFSVIQFVLIAAVGAALARFEPARAARAALAAGLVVALVGAWFSLSHLGLAAA